MSRFAVIRALKGSASIIHGAFMRLIAVLTMWAAVALTVIAVGVFAFIHYESAPATPDEIAAVSRLMVDSGIPADRVKEIIRQDMWQGPSVFHQYGVLSRADLQRLKAVAEAESQSSARTQNANAAMSVVDRALSTGKR